MEIPITCKGSKTIPIDQLMAFQGALKELDNPNFEKARRSIEKHGFAFPVFVWRNMILDGHQRLFVVGKMIEDGHTIDQIPVAEIFAENEKEAAEKLLLVNSHYAKITNNGLAEFARAFDLDIDSLAGDLELPDIDMDAFLDSYHTDDNPVSGEDDEIPDPPIDPITKTGDLWLLGEHRLLCGDSLSGDDFKKVLNGKSIDLVFTDPPYGVSYADKNIFLNSCDKGNRIQKEIKSDHLNEKDIQGFWKKHFELIRDNLSETNSYYITGPQIQGMMMMMMMQEAGLPYRHVIIWVKNNHVLGRCDYNYKHEPIFFGWTTRHKFYGKGDMKTSVWPVDKPLKNDLHPTMKPVALMVNAILNSSQKGDIVFDGFLGSGSTLIASEKTGRKCYGMEIDPAYCDVIVKRWEDYTGQKATR